MDERMLMEKFDKLNRKMRRYFSSYFTEPTLTSIQALVLHFIILESRKRDVFPKDLEEFLEIKPSSINSLINSLEKNGYLKRVSSEDDGRYKKLVLTDKTYAIEKDIVARVDDYMKSIFVGISDEDLKVFDSVLVQMTKNIE